MLSKYLLGVLYVASGAFALALPTVAQTVLLEPQQDAKPSQTGVVLAFKRSGEDHESTFQFPLRQPLKGSVLHTDPWSGSHKAISSMKIVSVLDMESAAAGSREELARVRCRIAAQFSAEEESAASAAGVELGVWPTFRVEDGVVVLDRSESRWFLGGRCIESVECW